MNNRKTWNRPSTETLEVKQTASGWVAHTTEQTYYLHNCGGAYYNTYNASHGGCCHGHGNDEDERQES